MFSSSSNIFLLRDCIMAGAPDEDLNAIQMLARAYMELPPTERREAALTYLFEVGEILTNAAGSDDIVAPLLDIIPFIANCNERLGFEERRQSSTEPSATLLARVSIAMDALIGNGHTAEQAAQILARQLVRAGANLPSEGGDPRAWRRLLIWRERLLALKRPAEAWAAYQDQKSALASEPRSAVLAAVNDGSLWNQRRAG